MLSVVKLCVFMVNPELPVNIRLGQKWVRVTIIDTELITAVKSFITLATVANVMKLLRS